MELYVYEENGDYRNFTDLEISLKYKCSLDKPCQELTFVIPYSCFTDAFPSFYLPTGRKVELYGDNNICRFRGKIETTSFTANEEKMTCVCYDYIRNLMKSKITYNFKNITAYSAVKTIFDDLQVPYNDSGIFGGENGEGGEILINHLRKNKSAYDACMMIATELHRQLGTYYYMYMTPQGVINIMPCDEYWSRQTIKPCSSSSLRNPDGNLIAFSYKEDASNIVNRILLYDSKGNKIDFNTGETEEIEEENPNE